MPLTDFEQRERALLGSRYDTLYTASPLPVRGVTVNPLRCTPAAFARQSGLPLTPSPFCAQGFVLTDAALRPGLHPYHHAGAFYVQEPSASAPAPLLAVQPGQWVLDLCAAPGGKSSQLAAALAGQGFLCSNEFIAPRAQVLRSNLERLGFANTLVLNEAPARLAECFPERFDRVLVDTPCSGEGMFRKEPQAVAQHSNALVEQCAALGATILDAAAAACAPGGVLVYSTCTFAPQEDEAQVGAFLARHPEFALLDSGAAFGLPGEENRCGAFPCDTAKLRRIWPCHGGEGHFMAKLQKAGVALPHTSAVSVSGKLCGAWQAFCADYFPALTAAPALLRKDSLYLPASPLPVVGLRLVRDGVLAGSLQKGRFVPGHHLFTAYGAQCQNCERLTLADPRTAAYLRGEEIAAETAQNGWCAVLVDGMPLGGGKVSGGRVKNHYPKALRNLK